MEQISGDPRSRRLGLLALIALLLVIFAAVALWRQSGQLGLKYEPAPMFPELPHQARNVARIHVGAKNGNFDVAYKPGKGWVISSRNDFPASFEEVNRTVVGMANMERLEPKTARADWLHFLSLDAPPKGDGVLIALFDSKGGQLATIITGKGEDIGDRNGANGVFVRKPDSTQSWLVRSTLQPVNDVTTWYEKNLLGIERPRIAETDVAPQGAPAYAVKRDKPADTSFKLLNPPSGRQLPYPGAAESVGAAVVGLTFDDVKPAKQFDFSHAWHIASRTFDGLNVTLQVMKQGQDFWATIAAQGANAKAMREAQSINTKTAGWAYKLPPYKGQQLMTSLDAMLKPVTAPNAAPAAAVPPPPAADDNADSDDQ